MNTPIAPIWSPSGVTLPSGEYVNRPSRMSRSELELELRSAGAFDRSQTQDSRSVASALCNAVPDSLVMLCFDRHERLICTYLHHTSKLSDGSFRAAIKSMPHPARVQSVTFASRSTITNAMRIAADNAAKDGGLIIRDTIKV